MITFKLKHPTSRLNLNRYFWYLKESSAGVDNTISGEVVYPKFEDTCIEMETPNEKMRQVKIEGCHYKLSETQIRNWLDLYGKVVGDVSEEAIIDEVDGTCMGTGAYLAMVNLSRRLPNWLPMFGMKVKLFQDGICKTCNHCFIYHKKETVCHKKKWENFVIEFKFNNPSIDPDMINGFKDEDLNCEEMIYRGSKPPDELPTLASDNLEQEDENNPENE